jgi:release factor glutamine methyltransferase
MIVSEELGFDNSNPTPSTVTNALHSAANRLHSTGIETPQLDARLLLQAVLGVDHSTLISISDRLLSKAELQGFDELIERRQNREPVHRIIGQKEFWGLNLNISEAVLEPRADTECLVDAVLAYVDYQGRKNDPLRIADIGTGSGAIVLALLTELPKATAVASDISQAALSVAQVNAKNNQLDDRVLFLHGSYLDPLSGTFDLIVSNPPYIPSKNILELEPEVRENDPTLALDGGVDGLDAYRCLLGESSSKLEPGGHVFFEIGYDQADDVSELANDNDWMSIKISKDYGGNDRVFAASR